MPPYLERRPILCFGFTKKTTVIRVLCDFLFHSTYLSFLFSDPQQAYLPGRGDHPVCIPDVHHSAVHCLPLLSRLGHTHGGHGGHRRGCPERHPHQGGQTSGDGPQGWPSTAVLLVGLWGLGWDDLVVVH